MFFKKCILFMLFYKITFKIIPVSTQQSVKLSAWIIVCV
jgi:hypothetical protein